MSDDLERRLADALREQRLPDAPDTLRAFLERLPAEADARPPERRLRLAWLAPALVVAVVATLLFALVPRSTTPPANTPSPKPSVPAVSGIAWSQVATDSDSLLRGASVASITAFRDGFVMVGRGAQSDGAVWWYSPDGTSWQRHDADPVFAGSVPSKVVAYPGGLLIVGTASGLDRYCGGGVLGCNPVSELRMWTSSDGQTWQAVPPISLAGLGRAEVWDVTSGPTGLVAVGARVPPRGEPIGTIWTSSDGRTWAPASQFSSAFPALAVAGVVATGSGYIAEGLVNGVNGTQDGSAWYSPDGRTWQQARGAEINGPLVAASGGALNITADPSGSATAWVTGDGASWSQAADPPFTVDIRSSPILLSDGGRILAIGTGRSSGTAGAWTSTDGQSWRAVPEIDPPPITYIPAPTGALGPSGAALLVSTETTPGVTTTTLWFGAFSVISEATPEPSASSVPLAGTTVYTARFIYPMPYGAWSPDGQLLAAEDETNATVRVFTTEYHQVWSHPGRFAAWVGPASLAVLAADPNDPTHSHLSIYYVLTPGPPVGGTRDIPGTYMNLMLAAPDGALAVATGDTYVTGFVLVNPQPVPVHNGEPLAWSPDGRWLAYGVRTGAKMGTPDILGALDVTTGEVRDLGIEIDRTGVTWDRTGTKLIACVIADSGASCHASLIAPASGTVTTSPIEGEITRAAQLADGRWVITAGATELWDPSQPGRVVPLGDRLAVSPLGAVAVFEPGSGESPASLPPLAGVQVIHIAAPMPDFWAFSPDGSHFAYTEGDGTQMHLKIATLPTTGG